LKRKSPAVPNDQRSSTTNFVSPGIVFEGVERIALPALERWSAARSVLGLDPRHPDAHPVGRPAVDVTFRQLAEADHSNQRERGHDRGLAQLSTEREKVDADI
jgi:hypothetical protein